MAKPNLRLVTPTRKIEQLRRSVRQTLICAPASTWSPTRSRSSSRQPRPHRYGYRDALMVLLAYRHGLRAAEAVDLRCGSRSTSKPQPCTSARAKNGTPATHSLSGREMRELCRHQRESTQVAVRVCLGTRSAAIGARLLPHDRTGSHRGRSGHQDACPHAAPCLRLQTRQRWPRYAGDPGVSGSPQYPEHDALYCLSAGSVQGFLARLTVTANAQGLTGTSFANVTSASTVSCEFDR